MNGAVVSLIHQPSCAPLLQAAVPLTQIKCLTDQSTLSLITPLAQMINTYTDIYNSGAGVLLKENGFLELYFYFVKIEFFSINAD